MKASEEGNGAMERKDKKRGRKVAAENDAATAEAEGVTGGNDPAKLAG